MSDLLKNQMVVVDDMDGWLGVLLYLFLATAADGVAAAAFGRSTAET